MKTNLSHENSENDLIKKQIDDSLINLVQLSVKSDETKDEKIIRTT